MIISQGDDIAIVDAGVVHKDLVWREMKKPAIILNGKMMQIRKHEGEN
jgi:hypothetical protein